MIDISDLDDDAIENIFKAKGIEFIDNFNPLWWRKVEEGKIKVQIDGYIIVDISKELKLWEDRIKDRIKEKLNVDCPP